MVRKALKHLQDTVTFKKTKFPFPDPCIRLRKGAIHEFAVNFFDPTSSLRDEFSTIFDKKKKVKKQPFTNSCLYAKKRGKR